MSNRSHVFTQLNPLVRIFSKSCTVSALLKSVKITFDMFHSIQLLRAVAELHLRILKLCNLCIDTNRFQLFHIIGRHPEHYRDRSYLKNSSF